MDKLIIPEAIEIEITPSNGIISEKDTLCFCLQLFAKNKIQNEVFYSWYGYDYMIRPIFSEGNRVYIPEGFITAHDYAMPIMEWNGRG